MKEYSGAVRTIAFPIWKIRDVRAEEIRGELFELSRECQQIANLFWTKWLLHHFENGSAAKIREWLELPRADRGVFPVNRMSNALSNEIYHLIRERHPGVHTRTVALLASWLNRTMSARKSKRGNLKGWVAILLDLERAPQYTSPVPIRCDGRNAKLEWSAAEETALLKVRLASVGGATAGSLKRESRVGANRVGPQIVLELRSGGRGIASQLATFRKIVSGDCKYLNTQLAWNQRTRKWEALISYQRPTARVAGIDPCQTAQLWPGRTIPFLLRMPGHERFEWLIGRGAHIRAMRQRVARHYRERGENYTHASRKRGKGRGPYSGRFPQWWRNFVTSNNQQVADAAYRWCVQRGIGRLVYYQPDEAIVDRRAATWLGRDNVRDQRTWDYFGLKTKLANKFEGTGIEFVCVKCGANRNVETSCV